MWVYENESVPITSFQLDFLQGREIDEFRSNMVTELVRLSDLERNTMYTVRVVAVNLLGDSPAANVNFTTSSATGMSRTMLCVSKNSLLS